MDSISRALVRTVEGPRGLLEEVATAAAAHLEAQWTVLALADGRLVGARPRFVAVTPDGRTETDERRLPPAVRRELGTVRAGLTRPVTGEGWVRVPMTLEGVPIGTLAGLHGLPEEPDASDLSVLRILANQAAVSLHTSEQYQATLAHAPARPAAVRRGDRQGPGPRRPDGRAAPRPSTGCTLASERELLDTERHRIALELHDSVTQCVLSAGMAVELARGEAEALGPAAAPLEARLSTAKTSAGTPSSSCARPSTPCTCRPATTVSTLPELLHEVAGQHDRTLTCSAGRGACRCRCRAPRTTRSPARSARRCSTSPPTPRRAGSMVRLRYGADEVVVSVADDDGPATRSELRRMLRLEPGRLDRRPAPGPDQHATRMADLGGIAGFPPRPDWAGSASSSSPPAVATRLRGVIEGLVGPSSTPTSTTPAQET